MTDTIPNVGEIVEYTVSDPSDPANDGIVRPLLVVNRDDADTYSGIVFLTDGITRYVHVVPDNPEQDAENAANAEQSAVTNMAKMTPAERDSLRAALAGYDTPAPTPEPPAAPVPTPPASGDGTNPTPPESGSVPSANPAANAPAETTNSTEGH